MNDIGETLGGIIAGVVGLAVIAVAFSARANTAGVLSSFFSGLTNLVGVAVSPVTGQTVAGLSGGSWSTGAANTSAFAVNALPGLNQLVNTGQTGIDSGTWDNL